MWPWGMPNYQKRFVSPYYLFTEAKKTADAPPVPDKHAVGGKNEFPSICQVSRSTW